MNEINIKGSYEKEEEPKEQSKRVYVEKVTTGSLAL